MENHVPKSDCKLPDVLVLGAGVTGLVAAIALARTGLTTHIAGPLDTPAIGRTVALFDGSVQLLRNLGLWQAIAPHAAQLKTMRIVDDTGSLFSLPPVDFNAQEIGLEQFGFNVALDHLTDILANAARAMPNLTLHDATAQQVTFAENQVNVTLEGNVQLHARLLVGADGKNSLARSSAGIAVWQWKYPQTALTAVLIHRQPHKNISTEFQTRSGPCTLVPLPERPDGLQRSSLVWLMTPAQAEIRAGLDDRGFAQAVQKQIHFIAGAMQVEGKRGKFPMTGMSARRFSAERLALVGEAAHVFPPIGAQGLNLGLRDVGDLVDCLAGTVDAGAMAGLNTYQRLRQADVATRTLAVDALNRSLLTPILPVDFLRGAGLAALASIGPLRRAVMRAGVRPQRVCSLMQARASEA